MPCAHHESYPVLITVLEAGSRGIYFFEAAHIGDTRPADKACETKVVPT